MSFEGRELSQEEELAIVDLISRNTSIDVVCILDNNSLRDEICARKIQEFDESQSGRTGEFYKGTLRSGQVIECKTSIVVLGDVNPGAKIIAQGNIIILGALKGNAHAGCMGDRSCFVFALDMKPIQIQIGDLIAKSPDKEKTRKHLLRREKVQTAESQIAVARDGNIYIEPVTKDILNRM